ncbi:MAG: rRNA pseudouridine synthase [Acidobacteria bacterium]|nr:rRNA pseudouridine synthase [Acidobacteriota bacterium]
MGERLQKLIARAGIASRRKAEELILMGQVTVNGKVVTELGTKADPERDHIKVKGKLINPQLESREKVYILLYKPSGYLTSLSDPQKRPLVMDLLPRLKAKAYPVGRLDFQSEGLILLTNDGDFANLITSAKHEIPKTYHVKVKGIPNEKQLDLLRRGVVIEGRRTAPAKISELKRTEANAWYEVTIIEGRHHQIRKMFDKIGHSVVKLKRVAIGSLTSKGLKPGKYRHLSSAEVKRFFDYAKA